MEIAIATVDGVGFSVVRPLEVVCEHLLADLLARS